MTSFNVVLVVPLTAELAAEGPSDPDYESVVMELCSRLAETDCVFRMAGFGQEQWPVDIRYDLSTLIEQLPDLLNGLRSNGSVEVDLYGQGVERTLSFVVNGDRVTAACASRTGWMPNPDVEEIDLAELLAMIESVAFEFAKFMRMVWPQCAKTAPFVDWVSVR
ncbi:hypothetical protein GCM10022251_30330 [Phytohabitans flavus]|uniref:Uncharacterized protein n=1 Tax=Phytohabitans flavus TaxID=1076124 RepID=A0A6F8XX48_9ACTN|nr:hypothetical protein [Phytohabitans flavus]BCB78383.1 hypothetical protein Pflav_047930 [Phytohabitans flavus]